MSNDTTLRDRLVAAHRGKTQIETAKQPVPADVQAGLAVQAAVGDALGNTRLGYKVLAAPDGTPVAAVLNSPFLEPGGVYHSALGAEVRLEIEFGLRLSRDLPLRPGKPYSRAEVLDHCDQVFLGIEICESRLDSLQDVPFPLYAADQLNHGGYIVGPVLDARVLDDYADLTCFISVAGVTIYDQPAVHGAGDPMTFFTAYANRDYEFLGGLKAGQVVTTGSLCGGVLTAGRGEVVLKLAPLGTVEFTLR